MTRGHVMIFNQTIGGSGSGSGASEHGIFCNIRDNIDVPTSAETGESVTMTLVDMSGITIVSTIYVGTQISGNGMNDVDSWGMRAGKTEPAPGVGDSRSFTMPDSDVIIRLFE